jgi:hypothetical protein
VTDHICIRCPPGEGPCKIIPCPAEAATAGENTTTTDDLTSTGNTHRLTVSNDKLMFDNRTVISGEDEGGVSNSDGGTEDKCYKCPAGGGGCKPIPCPQPS